METPEQLVFARTQGCQEVQGYLFSRAVAAEEIPALLEQAAGRFGEEGRGLGTHLALPREGGAAQQ